MISVMLRAVLAWLGPALTTLFGGWRVFLIVTLMSFLSVYLYNLLSGILQEVLNYVTTQAQGLTVPSGMSQTYSFTEFAGYMLSVLKIPECMSFIVSALLFKFAMRKIPFIKW